MNQNHSLLYVPLSCDAALPTMVKALQQRGLQVISTFDLHQTRAIETGCTCPHHGTAKCDCQVVVLMVYGKESQPATIMAHGHEGQTWLSMVEFPGSTPTRLENKIREIIVSSEMILNTNDLS